MSFLGVVSSSLGSKRDDAEFVFVMERGVFLMVLRYFGCNSIGTLVNRAHYLLCECSGEMIGSMLFFGCGSF